VPVTVADTDALTQRVLEVGRAAGLVAVGVTTAEPFESTRRDLEDRKAAGLSHDMQFTYRNPSRSTDPSRSLPGARSLVAGAWPTPAYGVGDTERPPSGNHGRVGRYVWRDYYAELRDALGLIADELRDAGFAARVLADDNAQVDRAVARRAGLGWFGKNANILVPGHGSWVVLGAVVTDAELAPSRDEVRDGCGACDRCMTACPTDAIVAPGVVDARRCLAWLVQAPGTFPVEFRAALGNRIYGCDDCQEVCPPSRRVDHAADAPVNVDLVGVLRASDDELLAAHGRWYIAKRDPRHLRRNALIALGNVADSDDELVTELLQATAQSDDELLAEHARWAIGRIAQRAS
jgi:epoxyqueuosine reductase